MMLKSMLVSVGAGGQARHMRPSGILGNIKVKKEHEKMYKILLPKIKIDFKNIIVS
jgi:hypothetical protein